MKLFNLPFCLKQPLINLSVYLRVLYKQKSSVQIKVGLLIMYNKMVLSFISDPIKDVRQILHLSNRLIYNFQTYTRIHITQKINY